LFRLAYGLPLSQPQSWWGYLLLLPDGIGPSGFALGGIEWTLKHEVFYYMLLALLWYWRRANLVKIFLAAWAVAILAFSIYEPGRATSTYPAPRLLLFSTTHLPFIAGAYAYLYRDYVRIHGTKVGLLLATLVGAYEFFLHTEVKYLCVGLAAFLALTKIAAVEIDERKSINRVLIGFGDGSYGLYLMHLTVQAMLLPNLLYQGYPLPFIFVIMLTTSLAVGLGYGSIESAWYRWARRKVTFGRAVLPQTGLANKSDDYPALQQAVDEAR